MLKQSLLFSLVGFTVVSGLILYSSTVSADDSIIDEINITVPISCTMSGTGMNSHTATLQNNTYTPNIGTTTLHAFCNDANGFAIYAAGYTGDEIGGTNSTKLVGTPSAIGNIDTGTATSGNTSNWAMKLAITQDSGDTTGTNAVAIDNSFNNYHVVPNEYTKVAHKNTSTNMDSTTGGVKLTTTYAAFVNSTQPAGTYTGKVIYTLVHPASAPEPVGENQIGVIYDGNGLFFDQAGTKSTNKVIYERSCEDEYGYIGNEPAIIKTRNLGVDGTQNGPYSHQGSTFYEGDGTDPNYAGFEGANRLKLVINYGLSQNSVYGPDIADGNSMNVNVGDLNDNSINRSGTSTYVIDGSYTSVYMEVGGQDVNPDYNYGVYIQVYPIYDEPTAGASYDVIQTTCSYSPVVGTYAETIPWNGYWYDDNLTKLYYETADEYEYDGDGVIKYIADNSNELLGSTVTLHAYYPYTIKYNGNGSTAGTMNGFYTSLDTNTALSTADLIAYNFKKTGYGFAGWSANQSATVNNSKIYGPNEKIAGNELIFDNNKEATLYAVWVQSAGNLQSWSGCSSMQTGQVTALTDTRDNNVYTVGKLADGNCWMMENLRLDAVNSSDSTKAQGFGGVFSGLASSEDADFGNSTVANSEYSTSNITGNNRGYRFPRYNNNNTNIGGTNSSSVTLVATPGLWNSACSFDLYSNHECYTQYYEGNNNYVQWYGYGNYYTWAAAMANTTEINNASASESANTSICPTGWELPYGNTTGKGSLSGGFSYLDTQLGGTGLGQFDEIDEEIVSNRWRSYPNNFIYSGLINGSVATTEDRGVAGEYWSSTANSSQRSYYFMLSNNSVYPGIYNGYKHYGQSIRCLTPGT